MTTLEQLNARGQGYLPGLIGIEFLSLEPAHNGYLHAPAIIVTYAARVL